MAHLFLVLTMPFYIIMENESEVRVDGNWMVRVNFFGFK